MRDTYVAFCPFIIQFFSENTGSLERSTVLPIVSSMFLNVHASTMEKEAACCPEMSVITHRVTQHRSPEDHNLENALYFLTKF
jgi:hypothetical protein